MLLFASAACNNTKDSAAEQEADHTEAATTDLTLEGITKHIPVEFQVVQTEQGSNFIQSDFNGDNFVDFAVLVAKGENPNNHADSEDVRVLIYHGTDTGDFIKTSNSGNLSSAFVYENPVPQLKLAAGNVIQLSHQSMRHHYDLKFRYESAHKNYMLIGSESVNYGNAVKQGAGTLSTNFLTGTRIENLMDFDEENQKVIDLPEKTTSFEKALVPITDVSDLNVYKLIGG